MIFKELEILVLKFSAFSAFKKKYLILFGLSIISKKRQSNDFITSIVVEFKITVKAKNEICCHQQIFNL